MNKKLPARPNLDHLKSQAKSLLSDIQKGQPDAIQTFEEFHPPATTPKLSDAQFVIARKNGFGSWPKLVHYVETLRSLEGTWAFTSLQIESMTIPPESLTQSKLVINGDRFNMLSPEADYLGIFDIDIEATPNTIDIDFIEGPEEGNSSYGIFHLEGNDLRICLGLAGASRPTEFVARPGTQHALETLKRVSQEALVTEPQASTKTTSKTGEIGDPAEFQKVTAEMEELQGEWLALEIVNSGAPIPENYLSYGSRVCDGSRTTVTFGGQKMVDVYYRIPCEGQIDYLVSSGPKKDQLQYGIYKLEDGILTVCMADPGLDRPNVFTSDSGSGRTLTVWKRK